jgi:hypothetical protein
MGFDFFFFCYVLISSQHSAFCCCFSVFTADLGLDFMVGVVVSMGLWWFLLHRLCFTSCVADLVVVGGAVGGGAAGGPVVGVWWFGDSCLPRRFGVGGSGFGGGGFRLR